MSTPENKPHIANPQAPVLEENLQAKSAGIGERILIGITQAFKSSVGAALIGGAGGAVLGAVIGGGENPIDTAEQEISDAIGRGDLIDVNPELNVSMGSDTAVSNELINRVAESDGIDRTAVMADPDTGQFNTQLGEAATNTQSLLQNIVSGNLEGVQNNLGELGQNIREADNVAGKILETNNIEEVAEQQKLALSEAAQDLKDLQGESVVDKVGTTGAGAIAGATTGAAGGAMYGGAKGALWTNKIKAERAATQQSQNQGPAPS